MSDSFDDAGGPPHYGRMEDRVKALEEFARDARDRLVRIETRLDTFATKEDLHRELLATTWRIIGATVALCAAVFWMARNVAPPPQPIQAPSRSQQTQAATQQPVPLPAARPSGS